MMLDIAPLLETLNKLSDGRILAASSVEQEGEFSRCRVPVLGPNSGDRTDIALRRYAADWIRLQLKEHSADTKFEVLRPGLCYRKDGKEYPLYAIIHISWWPRPPVPEYEQFKRENKARREAE